MQHRRLAILVLAIATTLFSTTRSFAQCPPGAVLCPGNVCSYITNDPKHCGNCANACTTGDVCNSGQCSCPAPKMICGAFPQPVVCVNTATNANHCGACGTACAAGHVCTSGKCS